MGFQSQEDRKEGVTVNIHEYGISGQTQPAEGGGQVHNAKTKCHHCTQKDDKDGHFYRMRILSQ